MSSWQKHNLFFGLIITYTSSSLINNINQNIQSFTVQINIMVTNSITEYRTHAVLTGNINDILNFEKSSSN